MAARASSAASAESRSSAASGQNRSRSPGLGRVAGLPGHHPLAGPGRFLSEATSSPTSVPEDKLWFTGDTTLDVWVLKHIEVPNARAGLALIDVHERKSIIRVCMGKQHTARSISNYFQGCIRKAIAAKEFVPERTSSIGPAPSMLQHLARPLAALASPSGAEALPLPAAEAVTAAVSHTPAAAGTEPAPPLVRAGETRCLPQADSNDRPEIPEWARTCMLSFFPEQAFASHVLENFGRAGHGRICPTSGGHADTHCHCLLSELAKYIITVRAVLSLRAQLSRPAPSPCPCSQGGTSGVIDIAGDYASGFSVWPRPRVNEGCLRFGVEGHASGHLECP